MQTKPVQPKPVQKKPAKPVAKPMQKKDNNPWDDDVPKGYVRGEMGGLYKESVMKKHREEFGKALQSMKNHLRRVEEQAKAKEAKAAMKKNVKK